MTITNGYCSLAELKERLLEMWSYTASTISFSGTTITDSAYGLKRFENSDNVNALIKISGTSTNAGVRTVSAANANAITVTGSAFTTQAAGTAITIQKWGEDFSDPILESAITAASRQIDKYCGRKFYSATETHYFDANCYSELFIDDLLSVTTLKTDDDGDGTYETTWTANTDYVLWPYNASSAGEPYTEIRTGNSGNYYFPTNVRRAVQIAGSWGYCTTAAQPQPIKEACLLLAARLYKRKDAIFGVSGPNEFGQLQIIDKFDADVKMLLQPYRRLV